MQFAFYINIRFRPSWRMVQFTVWIEPVNSLTEHIIVRGRNGQLKFTSNRPALLRYQLRHRRPDFRLVEGRLREQSFEKMILEAVWEKLKDFR